MRSWRGKHRNGGIPDEPCVDWAGVYYLVLETPALLMDELRRTPLLPRTRVNMASYRLAYELPGTLEVQP